MFENPGNFLDNLGGSYVRFKERQNLPLSEEQRDLKVQNERKIAQGLGVLRKFKTRILESPDPAVKQKFLAWSRSLSERMAQEILARSLEIEPSPFDRSLFEDIKRLKEEYAEEQESSSHFIPPSIPARNLFRAAEDMLVRVEEKAGSTDEPDHELSKEELNYVMSEFTRGTNDLSINAIKNFFDQDTRVGGILSGGTVYLELVKKIVEKYGRPGLALNTFAIAVDKENNKAFFELGVADESARTVIICDDMIDKGGTVLTALWKAGEHFPNAVIRSGKGFDQAGAFEKRRIDKLHNELFEPFQDFHDLEQKGEFAAALEIYARAQEFAKKNGIELLPGWEIVKKRIDEHGKNFSQSAHQPSPKPSEAEA